MLRAGNYDMSRTPVDPLPSRARPGAGLSLLPLPIFTPPLVRNFSQQTALDPFPDKFTGFLYPLAVEISPPDR